MPKLLALLLALLVLLQSCSPAVVVVYFTLNRAELTRQYCVNRNKPQLHCQGSCHLRKQLNRAAEAEKKHTQLLGMAKLLPAVLPAARPQPASAPAPLVARVYRRAALPPYRYERHTTIFRPPLAPLTSQGATVCAWPG